MGDEKGGEIAEAAVSFGQNMAEKLKAYDDWADRMADEFLKRIIPGYENLPEGKEK